MRRAFRAAALAAVLAALGSAGRDVGAAASPTFRHPVLLVRAGVLYAAWSEAEGAAEGAAAVLRAPSGVALDTLRVHWVRDAVAALPLSAGGPAAVDSALAAAPERFWLEALAAPSSNSADTPGAAATTPSALRPPHGTLTVPLGAPPATLDPALLVSLAEKQVASQIFEGLVRFGPDLAPIPAAAESFERAGLRWRFHLRPGTSFHPGRPVRAADVVASLERALAPATAAPRVEGLADAIVGAAAFHAGHAASISGLRAVDSLTVEISIVRETAPILSELAAPAAYIVPVEVARRDPVAFARAPTGSGPFRILTSDSGRVVLGAVRGRAGGVDTLVFRRVADPQAAVLDFELGRLDVVSPPETETRRILASGDVRPEVLSVDEAATYYLGFNTRRPWLSDRAHRRVLAGSVDCALAVRVLVPGRARPASGLLPPVYGVPELPDSAWLMAPLEAQAQARGLAADAPALALWVPAGSQVGLRVCEFAAAAWRRLGYRVSLIVRPWPEFQRAVLDGRADVFYLSWFADGADPIAFVASLVESRRRGAGGNRTFYASPEVDAALAEARAANDRAAARAALTRAERLALADAPLLPLFHSVNVALVRPGVTGLVLDPLGAPRYDGVEVRSGR